jgi:hypothetical protein
MSQNHFVLRIRRAKDWVTSLSAYESALYGRRLNTTLCSVEGDRMVPEVSLTRPARGLIEHAACDCLVAVDLDNAPHCVVEHEALDTPALTERSEGAVHPIRADAGSPEDLERVFATGTRRRAGCQRRHLRVFDARNDYTGSLRPIVWT